MKFRRYGANGPDVSELTFGAMGIRHDTSLVDGVSGSLLLALENGVNLIDTARIYPGSEEIVARTLGAWTGARPFISTKVAPLDRSGFRFGGPLEQFYTPQSIRASIETSLGALGVDRIDIIHMHQWHYRWTQELDWLDVLCDLRREGKIGYVAISAQDHEHDALLEIVSQGLVDGVQVIINLFESRPMNALLPRAAEMGIGVVARCVFDSGGLTGSLNEGEFLARPFLRHAPVAEYRRRVAALAGRFLPDCGHTLAELSLRFVLSDQAVSSITLGMSSPAEVQAACDAVERGGLPAHVVQSIRRNHVWTKNFYEMLL